MNRRETDVLVLGSGIAGLVLAKLLAPRARVAIVTKKEDSASNTNFAQGGIAAVFDPDDSHAEHVRDTLVAGDGLCDVEAVEIMVREGPELVRRLVDWGAHFSRSPGDAEFELGREGGHSHRRIVHARDQTGREIERALLASVRAEPNVRVEPHRLAVRLTTARNRATGALIFDEASGEAFRYVARATVLATGGLGRIYRHTTNPSIATGDGLAMAHEIGARLSNLEFIQFHPTMFYSADCPNAFLVSEAVRGEGALLRTLDGCAFMDHYDPRGCLAPRDVVARAIASEMRRRGERYVLLDLTALDPDFIRRRFPFITSSCLEQGVDPTQVPIPVVPAAHYVCGGVQVDRNGQSNIEGLYATGEVASTGVHGANRLASNSLLEALVWSRRAADDIARRLPDLPPPGDRDAPVSPGQGGARDPSRIEAMLTEVRDTMWEQVGIVRSDQGLAGAEARLAALESEVAAEIAEGRLAVDLVECWNVVRVARLVTRSAIARKESRGLHYNADHPEKDEIEGRHDTVLR